MRTIRALAALLTFAAVLLAARPAVADEIERIDETHPFREGALLDVRNTNGGIEISTWDRAEVRIEAEKRARGRDSDAVREALAQIRVRVEPRDGGLEIETELPTHRGGFLSWLSGRDVSVDVQYRITLPRRADLEAQSVNGGLKIAGLSGRLRLRTTNGKIQVLDSGGQVEARTTNGGIDVELNEVAPDAELEFHTTNGGITVSLPSGLGAALSASTTNGTIDTDFPIQVQGRVSNRRLEGTIGGGGPRLELRTTNGRIRIRER